MGSFFINVQVHAAEKPVQEVLEKLKAAIKSSAAASGLEETKSGDEAERTVVLAAAEKEPWISVYDEAVENQDEEELDHLAQMLSRATKGFAVSILVHDSDVLRLHLHENGKSKSVYDSNPEFSGESRMPKKALEAAAKTWKPLLVKGSIKKLLEIWTTKYVFAEEALDDMAPLVGWEGAKCKLGYDYLEDDKDFITLRFGSRQKKAPSPEEPTGTPKILGRGGGFLQMARKGMPTRFHFTFNYDGPASKGLDLVVWGSALEQGLISVETGVMRKSPVPRKSKQDPPIIGEPFPLRDPEKGKYRIARLQDWELQPGLDFYIATFQAKCLSEGEGDLFVAGAPHQDPENGEGSFGMRVKIGPELRMPHRWPQDPIYTVHLIHLEKPTNLFALAALAKDTGKNAEKIMQAFEAWNEVLVPLCKQDYSLELWDEQSDRIITGPKHLKPGNIPKHKTWREAGEAVSGGKGLFAKALSIHGLTEQEYMKSTFMRSRDVHEPVTSARDMIHGFSYHRIHALLKEAREPISPHMGFWAYLKDLTNEERDLLEKRLIEIMDRLAKEIGLEQAMLGRWHYQPQDPCSVDATVYEYAFGIGSTCTISKKWCRRFLRGVTETLWLGPHLVEHAGPMDEVGKVASITKVGKGIRLQLKAGADLNALERALEKIVPLPDDWKTSAKEILAKRKGKA